MTEVDHELFQGEKWHVIWEARKVVQQVIAEVLVSRESLCGMGDRPGIPAVRDHSGKSVGGCAACHQHSP